MTVTGVPQTQPKWSNVRQLDAISRELLARLGPRAPARPT